METLPKLDAFTAAYLETALWSSTDHDTEEPLDKHHTIADLAPETLARAIIDCQAFQERFLEIPERGHPQYSDDELAGHDFWLTRNGHGAGFWDGDWSEPFATQATEYSKQVGQCDLYRGDDGKIYVM